MTASTPPALDLALQTCNLLSIVLNQEVALSPIIFTGIFVDNKEHLRSKKCLKANYTPEYIVFQCLGFKHYGAS